MGGVSFAGFARNDMGVGGFPLFARNGIGGGAAFAASSIRTLIGPGIVLAVRHIPLHLLIDSGFAVLRRGSAVLRLREGRGWHQPQG